MKSFQVKPLNKEYKAWATTLLTDNWGSARTVSRGHMYQADELPGFIAVEKSKPIGLITYNIIEKECEITTMNSTAEGKGVGSELLDAVKKTAIQKGCKRIWLITTNDNTHALHFWQRRGFIIAAVYLNAIEDSRRLKPEIPLTGDGGIPIRDEIELEMILG
jgi:ribosomal protein S18 acetylase RimI-like enzyme